MVGRAGAHRADDALLLLVDAGLPAAREEGRVGAEEQARGADDGERGLEYAFQRLAGLEPRPAVRARRVEMDRGTLVRRDERFAKEARAEMRHDDGHLGKRERGARQRQRIAEAEVEAARQSQ